ncbi:uncharacterized protein LOC129940529 [Eupeodes corollae]|uniref:uncharacterized protein LOC129940529 n=1 Tax=Eupeodes corollae TaxID=290404 RepID=UPI002490999C|nr:uncharacterized protein LOC129940529 [Eupeodes corollae]XP_055904871.1 uncharacterized protein LOC129940529 [Eupeodes corollae]XP_055904872.1 uncharacterized protein LOC129940529 [Eupeodes corollae]XP_055904873.1 uncharacterized protein LOC129940529 [Eupeodes corollae]XP_055904874.1 uncharacterized protein LOC129940529 [Eupeodes corollae]
MSWPDKNPQEAKQIQISLSAATDDVGELNPSIFTQKINIKKITTRSGSDLCVVDNANRMSSSRSTNRGSCIVTVCEHQCKCEAAATAAAEADTAYIEEFCMYYFRIPAILRNLKADKIEAELKEFLMPIESQKLLFRSNWHRYKNAPTNCPNDVPRVAAQIVASRQPSRSENIRLEFSS